MVGKSKVTLVHGECDYLIFKELKSLKKDATARNVSVTEIFSTKSLEFEQIEAALSSSDLFLNENMVIIREIVDSRSFFPFVEKLTAFLEKNTLVDNELYIFNYSKVLKTSKIYKIIDKVGEIKEVAQPKLPEISDMIKKSLPIKYDAAGLLIEYTGSNLFQIKSEIEKLKTYLQFKQIQNQDAVIEISDIEALCIKNFAEQDAWGVGTRFLNYHLQPSTKLKKELVAEVDRLLINNIAVMQILYSFYQYVLSAIKLKSAQQAGKIKSERDAFTFGYFFVKEFYKKANMLNLQKLYVLNSKILDIEFQIKSGKVDETLGLKKLVLEI